MSFHFSAEAETKTKRRVFLSHCSHSFHFPYCINENFDRIERATKQLWFSYCFAPHQGSTYFFTQCVQDNFFDVQRHFHDLYFINYCYNYSHPYSGFSWNYVHCVNDNFRKIEDYLNGRGPKRKEGEKRSKRRKQRKEERKKQDRQLN